MKSINTKRPKIKGSKRPYISPPKITQTGRSVKAYMKRLRIGKA